MWLCGIVRHSDLGCSELGNRVWQYKFTAASGLDRSASLEIEMGNMWGVSLLSLPE